MIDLLQSLTNHITEEISECKYITMKNPKIYIYIYNFENDTAVCFKRERFVSLKRELRKIEVPGLEIKKDKCLYKLRKIMKSNVRSTTYLSHDQQITI
jgi:hypothetical protein